jgi:hypothetical protein
MPSILVATGFVRIDADTKPALKAVQALGAVGAQALSTTLLPAAAAAAAGIAAIGGAAAAAGAALGAFGLAVKPQITSITEAVQQNTKAQDAQTKADVASAEAKKIAKQYGFEYGKQVKITSDMTADARAKAEQYNKALATANSSTKAASMSQALFKEKMSAMPKATQDTANAFLRLQTDFKNWSDSLAGDTMPIFTRGIEMLRQALPKLTPFVKIAARQIMDFMNTLGEGSAGKIFREFGSNMQHHAGGALKNFLNFSKNMIAGVLGILNAFAPMQSKVTGGLADMGQSFADWSANLGTNSGFQTFIKTAQEGGPRLGEVFSAVARALKEITSAAGPLSGVGLKVLEIFAKLIDAIPTPVLRALVPAIIAVNLAMKAYAVYQALATAATWLFAESVTVGAGATYASRAALVAGVVAFVAHRIATIASTVATWAWTAATYAFAVAQLVVVGVVKGLILVVKGLGFALKFLFTNPVGLAILALVALGIALYEAWKHSETFRNIVKTALNAVADVAKAVGAWFAGPFVRFFTETIPRAFGFVLDWVKRNWPWLLGALTGPIGLAVVWIIKHWQTVKDFFIAAWNGIKRYVVDPIIRFFTVSIPNAARILRDLVVRGWNLLANGVKAAWDFIYKWVIAGNIRFFTERLPAAARTLRDRVVGFWNGLKDGVNIAYGWVRDRVFGPLNRFFTERIPGWAKTMKDKVVGFFGQMKDGVGRVWDGVRDKAKSPINWVIDHVWNKGIVKVWKTITGWIGLSNKLGTVKLLASGGTVGNEPFGLFNRPTAIVGEGNPAHPEYVIPTDPKYRGRALNLWQAAGAHFMEDGGVIGWLGDKAGKVGSAAKSVASAVVGGVKGIADFLVDPVGKAKKILLGPLKNVVQHIGNSPWAQMSMRFPHMAVDGLVELVKKAAGGLIGNIGGALGLGSSGGSGVKRWSGVVLQALRMVGQPAGLLDLTLRRMNQESGGNPTIVNKWDSNWQAGHPSVGLMQVIGPTFRSYAGVMKKTGPFLYGVSVNPLANVYASMRYALATYGSLMSAYGRKGGYANGTNGTTSGWHLFGERGPELGYSPAGWRILNARRTAGLAGGAGLVIERLVLENHGIIGSRQEVENWLVDALTTLKRKGRTP